MNAARKRAADGSGWEHGDDGQVVGGVEVPKWPSQQRNDQWPTGKSGQQMKERK
jgi:hypothetical protein